MIPTPPAAASDAPLLWTLIGQLVSLAAINYSDESRSLAERIEPLISAQPSGVAGELVGQVEGGDPRWDGKFMNYVVTDKPLPFKSTVHFAPPIAQQGGGEVTDSFVSEVVDDFMGACDMLPTRAGDIATANRRMRAALEAALASKADGV